MTIKNRERHEAKITRFVDGDTIEILINCGFDVFLKRKIRLRDYSAIELYSEHQLNESGVRDLEILKQKLQDTETVEFEFFKYDLHGRIVADLFYKLSDGTEHNLNEELRQWKQSLT